jgi:ATP-dependent RNA helicase SUPV3L1/SUV3
VRFGQFTIFMPLLLKPAPTRLRLVLWSLSKGLQDFPEAPPPGLVTVPTIEGLPDGTYTMSGYRAAGARAIRIDMLERLADMLRDQNTRAGFEATADMLSITGMTLEQFANLMEGLGYKAEKGEREKVKAVTAEAPAEVEGETPNPVPEGETAQAEPTAEAEAPEVEGFYTFAWAPKRNPRPQGDKPQRKGPPKGKRGGKPQRDNKAQNFSARPPRKEKAIDPDNPFAAALAGLKKD